MIFHLHWSQSSNMYQSSRYYSKIVSGTWHFQTPHKSYCLGPLEPRMWGLLLHSWAFWRRFGIFPTAFLFVHEYLKDGVRSVTQTVSSLCNLTSIHHAKPYLFLPIKVILLEAGAKTSREGGGNETIEHKVDYHKQSNKIRINQEWYVCNGHCHAKCPEC